MALLREKGGNPLTFLKRFSPVNRQACNRKQRKNLALTGPCSPNFDGASRGEGISPPVCLRGSWRKSSSQSFQGRFTCQAARRFGAWLVLLSPLLVLNTLSRSASAGSDISLEAQVKAVFLFNFAQFTEWPAEAFEDQNSPIVIGIVGADPFGDFLDKTVENEIIHGRHIRIERYRSLAQVKNWHILYAGSTDPDRIEQVLRSIKGKPVLTVSELENAPREGGIIIRFVIKNNKVRFIINAQTARDARLVFSSKLLHAADAVLGLHKK
jgi:hypothetical protein